MVQDWWSGDVGEGNYSASAVRRYYLWQLTMKDVVPRMGRKYSSRTTAKSWGTRKDFVVQTLLGFPSPFPPLASETMHHTLLIPASHAFRRAVQAVLLGPVANLAHPRSLRGMWTNYGRLRQHSRRFCKEASRWSQRYKMKWGDCIWAQREGGIAWVARVRARSPFRWM